METTLGEQERYFQLEGVIFRVRLDRLDRGSQYLRNGTWVWTPITSGSVIRHPHARELTPSETEGYRAVP
jgi:hypothetical protein